MTYVWGQYSRGRLQAVTGDYDAPQNEIVEVHETYGVPAGILESVIFENVKSGVESNGATLTFCQIDTDWLAFQTRIVYQYRSPGLLVSIIVLGVLALLIILGLWLLLQSIYRVLGPVGVAVALIVVVVVAAVIVLGAGGRITRFGG